MRFRSKSPITHQGQLYGAGAGSGKRGGRLGGPKRKEGSAPSHLASRSYHHSAPPLTSSARPSCQWQGQPHRGLSTSTLLRVSPWRCTAPASGTWALNTPAPPCEPPGPRTASVMPCAGPVAVSRIARAGLWKACHCFSRLWINYISRNTVWLGWLFFFSWLSQKSSDGFWCTFRSSSSSPRQVGSKQQTCYFA